MDNKLVDLVVLMDRSASMSGFEDETIGAFNAFLREQKEVEGDAVLTLVLFDHEQEVIHYRTPIQEVEEISRSTYYTRGNTAMYDCFGGVISALEYANTSDKVLFLIQSDGEENCSIQYSGSLLKSKIAEKEKIGWDFQFIGTGIDAIREGSKFGMSSGKCMSLGKNARGFEAMGATISSVSTGYRTKE